MMKKTAGLKCSNWIEHDDEGRPLDKFLAWCPKCFMPYFFVQKFIINHDRKYLNERKNGLKQLESAVSNCPCGKKY